MAGGDSKKKYLRRFGCLAYFKPHKKKKEDRNQALMPRMLKGIHLGFSDNNSGWIIGTMEAGRLSVYETRSVTFCEEILVRNIEMLKEPDPSIFEQLLEKASVLTEKQPAAGSEKSVVGDVAEHQAEGLTPIEWDEPDSVSAGS